MKKTVLLAAGWLLAHGVAAQEEILTEPRSENLEIPIDEVRS